MHALHITISFCLFSVFHTHWVVKKAAILAVVCSTPHLCSDSAVSSVCTPRSRISMKISRSVPLVSARGFHSCTLLSSLSLMASFNSRLAPACSGEAILTLNTGGLEEAVMLLWLVKLRLCLPYFSFTPSPIHVSIDLIHSFDTTPPPHTTWGYVFTGGASIYLAAFFFFFFSHYFSDVLWHVLGIVENFACL